MPVAAGTRLGPYEIVAPIGAGGMGEVYKARDTRLDRTVAVKVLPSHISAREDLRQRFEREARAISSLNHPNICTLHDIGSDNGTNFIVMEHLQGETLFDRLQRGPLPLDQALKYAAQIGDAVDRAHRSGVVHRDLKPGNIMITPDGAKVLDFGLAKSADPEKAAAAQGATLTVALTSEGTVLGTPQYMAPEQIEGSEADARTDIFAFGCVLYEMITGKRAFDGKTRSSVIGAILATEPPPISAVQPVSPPLLDKLVQRCLAKDPNERWHCMRDVVLELRSVAKDDVGSDERMPARTARSWIPWAVAAGVLAASSAIFAFLWWRTPVMELPSMQFLIHAPEGTQFTNPFAAVAISSDGRQLVFGAASTAAPARLWLRSLDSATARPLPGTEGANLPFLSPDGKAVGYFAGGKLKRNDIAGGTTQVLCDATATAMGGGTWSRNGVILFGTAEGLSRVSASGGVPENVTEVDRARKETGHGLPHFLPDGNRFLFYVDADDPNVKGAYVSALDKPRERIRVLATDTKAFVVGQHAGTRGHLLWARDNTLVGQPFDVKGIRAEGEPAAIAQDVRTVEASARAPFWASDTGVLVYRRDALTEFRSKLVWLDRSGRHVADALPEDRYASFRLSPDGTRVLLGRIDDAGGFNVWSFEFARQVMTRLTFDARNEGAPVWSGDGRRVAFYSDRSGRRQIYIKDATGAGQEQHMGGEERSATSRDWSRDGSHILYVTYSAKDSGLWVLTLGGAPKATRVLQTVGAGDGAQFSPDGKWIAY